MIVHERHIGRLLARRLGAPIFLLVAVLVVGAFGYQAIGAMHGQDWPFLDCVFMAVISLLTVGYSDDLGVHQYAWGRMYTVGLLLAGAGVATYAFSSITAFVVEGHIRRHFKERRMQRDIENLAQHTIIRGCGTTGLHVVQEHVTTGVPFVVLDKSREAIDNAREIVGDFPFIADDATDEKVLEAAGIARARALVSALADDKDNLFLVVTARYLRKELPIIVKAMAHGSEGKFRAAGATDVVSPTFIGGMRIASLVVRPQVVTFLDTMLRAKGKARVSEAVVDAGSKLDGMKLGDASIQNEVGLSVVALKHPHEPDFVYAPGDDVTLQPGTTIIVIGPLDRVHHLEAMASRDGAPHPVPMQ